MIDSFLNRGRRGRLVKYLSEKNIYSSEVIRAIGVVPRHIFIGAGLDHFAYEDRALPIGQNQTISQPSTVALQSHLLNVNQWDKVLEIGTGCGYQTAVLAEMGVRVYSVERQKSLYLEAQKNLARLGYDRPILVFGDGYKGLPLFAPFKGILVTCGADKVPQALIDQLQVGGRLVIPIGKGEEKEMTVFEKISENEIKKTTHGKCSFVPMLSGVNK